MASTTNKTAVLLAAFVLFALVLTVPAAQVKTSSAAGLDNEDISFPGRKMLTAAATAARSLLGVQKTQTAQHGYGYGYGRGHYGGGYNRPGAYHGRPSYGRPYYGRYHG